MYCADGLEYSHLWLNWWEVICDELLQQTLDLLSGLGIPGNFEPFSQIPKSPIQSSSSSSLSSPIKCHRHHHRHHASRPIIITRRKGKPSIWVDWRTFVEANLKIHSHFQILQGYSISKESITNEQIQEETFASPGYSRAGRPQIWSPGGQN